MSKKNICFIAQFPPPIHGLSKAVDTLYHSELADAFEFEKIDITNNKNFFKTMAKIYRSKADLFYFTISQTKGGNLRDLLILKLLRMQHKKCLIHLHGGYYRKLVDCDLAAWQRKANYKAVAKLNGAIVLGKSLAPIFEGMLADDQIFVVPNCVDDAFLMNQQDFDAKLIALEQRTVKHVLYLSNFISSKGYPHVLEMARLEKERCESGGERRFHFHFAGAFFENEEEKFFFDYIHENSLDDYITYHGLVDGDQKRELLTSCDLFALLTQYPNEGQPISILEAMGNGAVVLTTNHAGIPDIVENKTTGLVFDVNDSHLAEKVYSSIQSMDFARIARNARRSVCENYTQKNYIENMAKIFQSR